MWMRSSSKCFSIDKTCLNETFFRSFDYKEKAAVDKYYPQYYHKTDKASVNHIYTHARSYCWLSRMDARSTLNA